MFRIPLHASSIIVSTALAVSALAPEVALASDAAPIIASKGPDKIAVTIYPDDLAMVTEMRTVNLPAGRSTIALMGVNDQIIPETVLLSKFGAVTIERNFDYDLISKSKLFETAVGEDVTLYRTYPGSGDVKVERAKIVSGGSGVVFQIGDKFETFQCSNLSERVQFDDRPPQLQNEPTLSLNVNAEKSGPQRLEFRYLASGFQWKADYILSPKDKSTASMSGWLTVTNGTNIGVKNAELAVVGGTLSRLEKTKAPHKPVDRFAAHCQPKNRNLQYYRPANFAEDDTIIVTGSRFMQGYSSSSPIADREDLGDYKLYTMPFSTTLAPRQTKQLLFLQKPQVDFNKRFVFDFSSGDKFNLLARQSHDSVFHAVERYEVDNSREGRLAEPLPRGVVRVMPPRHNGELFYHGESEIKNLAVDSAVNVDAGFNGNVAMFTREFDHTQFRDASNKLIRTYVVENEFVNTSDEVAEVEFSFLLHRTIIKNANIEPIKEDSAATWRMSIPVNASRVLRFHVERRQ